MSQPGRDAGSQAHLSGTGLAELLAAFAAHGGEVAGARRWAENPLALTNVRWRGPAGQLLDAARHQGDEGWLSQGEREAWVQLALHYPATAQPTPSGPSAPWVSLDLERAQAQSMVGAMARSRPASGEAHSWGRASYGTPAPRSGFPLRGSPSDSIFGSRPSPFPGGLNSDPRTASQQRDAARGSFWPSASPSSSSYAGPASLPEDPVSQAQGGWRASPITAQEMVVIPCIEVELPPSVGGAGSEDFARDYARDVALHFARAAHTIPQVRELRAWMRGDRLVLAARMVLGMGNRPLTRAEMDGAAQLLADVLAQRTLPYSRLSFAEPNEWQAGAQMPE